MYAIVDLNNKQYKVEEGRYVDVDLLDMEDGLSLILDKVLLLAADDGKATIGQPFVKGAEVKASIMNSFRDDKVTIYKMHRKKGYRLKKGHRQNYTRIRIESIKA